MNKLKPTVYVDMDDTALDFTAQHKKYSILYPTVQYPQSVIGFFSSMSAMEGFFESWIILSEYYDMRFLSRASPYNINSYSEKAMWVRDNIGGIEALEKLNLNPDKSIVGEKGDYLIDDWDIHGQKEFKGMHVHFGKDPKFLNWKMVTKFLLSQHLINKSND